MPQLNIDIALHKGFIFLFFFLLTLWVMYLYILPFVSSTIKIRQYFKVIKQNNSTLYFKKISKANFIFPVAISMLKYLRSYNKLINK